MYFNRVTNLYLQTSSWLLEQIPMGKVHGSESFEWDAITPHSHFQWHSCYGDFQCARLQVPMDWQGHSTEANMTVEIAVVKLEATVVVTDKTYGGAVVFNPGGPGGSGVRQVTKGGHDYRTMLSAGPDSDQSTAKNFDIIGFDPRGINNTRPLLACFPDHLAAAAHAIEESAYGWPDTSSVAFDNLWAMKRAFSEGCSERAAKEGIAKHMSTAPVARDIIEIFERHGEWREKEARRILASDKANTLSSAEKDLILQRTAYKPGKEMVQYWGFSYGTILGATLTAMFPERIHRAILDGVSDAFDYMKADWRTNLRDTDRQFDLLTEYCYQGGPENCAIYDSQGPKAIGANILKTLAKFRTNPISIPGNDNHGPAIVTLNDLQRLVFREIVYNPLTGFPDTVKVLDELSRGQGTTLADIKRGAIPIIGQAVDSQCEKDGPYSYACLKPSLVNGMDWGVGAAIACSDGLPRTQETKDEFREYVDELAAQSALIGNWWATIMLPCTAWKARPDWRYDGNFTAKTAHPILFIGNTVDPVTPLHNAFMMAKGYEGAAVLHQNSEGHCSTASPSMCTGRAIREYFQSGTLPRVQGWSGKAAFCEPNRVPLDGYNRTVDIPLPEGETDSALWEAMVALNRAKG